MRPPFVPPPHRRLPSPPPLDVDARIPTLVGLLVWLVLGVLALVFHGELVAQGRGWWVWTPWVGMVLGLYGLFWLSRQHRG